MLSRHDASASGSVSALLISVAGWLNQHHGNVIGYLHGEKTACCASTSETSGWLDLNDGQRRRLA
jgi:hypothetical protein